MNSTLRVVTPASGDLASLAIQINAHHEACKAAIGEAIRHAIDAGSLLIEAKAHCSHGDWKDWLAENFAGTARTAQRYMRIAKNWPAISGPNATRMSDLSINDALEQISQATAAMANRGTGKIKEIETGRWGDIREMTLAPLPPLDGGWAKIGSAHFDEDPQLTETNG